MVTPIDRKHLYVVVTPPKDPSIEKSFPRPTNPLRQIESLQRHRIQAINLKKFYGQTSSFLVSIGRLLGHKEPTDLEKLKQSTNPAGMIKELSGIIERKDSWASRLERSRQYLLLGETGKALDDLAEVEKLQKLPELYYLKAEAFRQSGDWHAAEQAFELAIKLAGGSRESALKQFPEGGKSFTSIFDTVKKLTNKDDILKKKWESIGATRNVVLESYQSYAESKIAEEALKALVETLFIKKDGSSVTFDKRIGQIYFHVCAEKGVAIGIDFIERILRFSDDKANPELRLSQTLGALLSNPLELLTAKELEENLETIQKMYTHKEIRSTGLLVGGLITDLSEAIPMYRRFPRIYPRLLQTKGLGPTPFTFLRNALKHISEQHLEVFLNLYERFPQQLDHFVEGMSAEQFARLGSFFQWIAMHPEFRDVQIVTALGNAKIYAAAPSFIITLIQNIPVEQHSKYLALFTLGPHAVDTLEICFAEFFKLYPNMRRVVTHWIGDEALEAYQKAKEFSISGHLRGLPQKELAEVSRIFFLSTSLFENFNKQIPELPTRAVEELFNTLFSDDKRLHEVDLSQLIEETISLIKRFPFLAGQFLKIMREDPTFILSLAELAEGISQESFIHLAENYFQSDKEMKSLKPFIKYLSYRPGGFEKLNLLLSIERDRNLSFFNFFSLDPKKLFEDIFDALVENETFSRQFHMRNFIPNTPYTRLSNRLKQNRALVYQVFNIASEYPDAIRAFLIEDAIWENKLPPTDLSRLFTTFCKSQKELEARATMRPLLILIGRERTSIAKHLIAEKDAALRSKIEKIILNGDVDLIEALYPKYLKDRLTQQILKDPPLPSPIARAILRLFQTGKEALAELILNNPDQNSSLLILHAQGDEKLLKEAIAIVSKPATHRSLAETRFLTLISQRRFNLARDYGHKSFRELLEGFPADASLQQDIHDLIVSLRALTWHPREVEAVMQFVRILLQGKADDAQLWISRMQVALEHQPKALREIINSEEWQQMLKSRSGMEKILKDPLFDVSRINDFAAILSQKDVEGNYDLLTRHIANCILTRGGTINRMMINRILDTPLFLTTPLPSRLSSIKRVLILLKNDPLVSDRLASVTLPPPGSVAYRLLLGFLESSSGTPLNLQTCRMAVLSTLLWPLRQSSAGSCFGTSIAIQQDSYDEGIKQSLEDFISIVSSGQLTRTYYNPYRSCQYPIVYDHGAFTLNFRGDNFLARAREFTIASMHPADFPPNNLIICHERITNLITTQKALLIKSYPDKTLFIEAFCNHLIAALKSSISAHFGGFIKQAHANVCGAWMIVDHRMEPLISSRTTFQNAFMNALTVFVKSLDSKDHDNINANTLKLLNTHFAHYFSSDPFVEGFFDTDLASFSFGFSAQ